MSQLLKPITLLQRNFFDMLELIVLAILAIWAVASTWYMIKFLRMVMFFEDILSDVTEDFDETIDTLMVVESSLEKVIQMPIFFENAEIRSIVDSAKNETKLSRVFVRKCVEKLIKKSKDRNILVKSIEVEDEEQQEINPTELYNEIEGQSLDQIQYVQSVKTINETMFKKTPNKAGVRTVFGRSS